jgi:hypothetical protein
VAAPLAICARPSVAIAQSAPAIPPAGYPPPDYARAAEAQQISQSTIAEVTSERQRELWPRAVQAVDDERHAAWVQRGVDAIAPATPASMPSLHLSLDGGFAESSGHDLALETTARLTLRFADWIGAKLGAGVLSSWDQTDGASPNDRTSAFELEAECFVSTSRAHGDSSYVYIGPGVQALAPFGDPRVPSTYVVPFVGLGTVYSIAKLGSGFIGIGLEVRVGYRVGLGTAQVSPLEGTLLNVAGGPVIGF